MSYPILYESDAEDFGNLGIGVLSSAISPFVTEERNGIFDFDMQYPVDGALFSEIRNDRIIKCDASPSFTNQLFRIVKITKPLDGICRVYAQHVSYLTEGLQLEPIVEIGQVNGAAALAKWSASIVEAHPFTTWSDVETISSTTFDIRNVENARQALGGVQGSILQNWQGEYKFDNYNVHFYQNRGRNRGVVIAYGKNLTSLTQEENIQNTFTSIYPYFTQTNEEGEEELVTLDAPFYIDCENANMFSKRRIKRVDFSDKTPTDKEALRSLAVKYMEDNGWGVPSVSLSLQYIDLAQTLEYADSARPEEVELCDVVTVRFERLGVETTAKVIRTVWDVVRERYDSIEIGEARSSLSTRLGDITNKIDELPDKSTIQRAYDEATEHLMNGKAGYIKILPSMKNPSELVISDTEDLSNARNVALFNQNGLGFSQNGYYGPYETAITSDGSIVADRITTGELNGEILVKGSVTADKLNVENLHVNKIAALNNPDNYAIMNAGDETSLDFYSEDSNGKFLSVGMQRHDWPAAFIRTNAASGINLTSSYQSNQGGTYESTLNVGTNGATIWDGALEIYPKSDENYGLYTKGINVGQITASSLQVSGTKSGVQQTQNYGRRLLYAYEMADNYFGDMGSSEVKKGECRVKFDPIFLECINTDEKYHVFLTPYKKGHIWVDTREADNFVVKGDNIPFAWQVMAKRRGFENIRLEESTEPNAEEVRFAKSAHRY